MRSVQLLFQLDNDDLTLKNVVIEYNDTGLPNDKTLLVGLAQAILTDTNMEQISAQAKDIINPKS